MLNLDPRSLNLMPGMMDAGAQELQRWQRYGRPLSLLLLDVDHFEQINDRHGHLVGDRVLVDAVAQMRGVLRRVDLLARADAALYRAKAAGRDRVELAG